jgi:hypothetical protein
MVGAAPMVFWLKSWPLAVNQQERPQSSLVECCKQGQTIMNKEECR